MEDTTLIYNWDRIQELIKGSGSKVRVVGDSFCLEGHRGNVMGMFRTINDLYYFLLGFDWGTTNGKLEVKS